VLRFLLPVLLVGLLSALWFGLPSATTAPMPMVRAVLSGFSEVPAISTTGSGSFEAKVSDLVIEYVLSYEALEGTPTLAAHIHLGQADVNGGVAVFLCGGGGRPACTPGSGTFTGTITAADVIGPTAQGLAPGEIGELVRAILKGATYANVHTGPHPGGEIRGQIRGENFGGAGP